MEVRRVYQSEGLVAWVQGQVAPAQVQHPDNRLLKSKSPNKVTHSAQRICAMRTLSSRLHPKVQLLWRHLHQALSHRAETCVKLCFRAQSCPYLLLSGCKELPTVHVGLHSSVASTSANAECDQHWVSDSTVRVRNLWVGTHSPRHLNSVLSLPPLRANALSCTGHANMFVSTLELAIDSNYSWGWWGK